MSNKIAYDMANLMFHWCQYPEQFYREVLPILSKHTGAILCNEEVESVRKRYNPEYKANRKHCSIEQQAYRDKAHAFWQGVKEYVRDNPHYHMKTLVGYEGDDLLALYHYLWGYSIVANDKDLLQVTLSARKIDGSYLVMNNLPKTITDCPDIEKDEYFYLLYLCLFGDVSDNIPRLIPSGKRAIQDAVFNLFLCDRPFEEASKKYGTAFADNLSSVLLPHPSLLDSHCRLFEIVNVLDNKQWREYVKENVNKEVKKDITIN